ncbi:FAD:protein FMN transferase [Aestuariimicrobium soli]|uniref:FAD:protein FMN transferase n=1 Tax=Aestuariimicrobium soli TaxID=2035834 RepID=UPI003EBC8A3D
MTTAAHDTERLVFPTMGTVCSLAVQGGLAPDLVDEVRATFTTLDERFSLYRPTSEASRVSRRELAFADASPEYRSAYWVAHDWGTLTDGAFNPFRLDGTIDLHGVVKALAMDATAELLRAVGDWCLNVGGDVLAHGRQDEHRPWVAGIVDPDDQQELISQVELSGDLPAVATSGTALRGEHIWRLPADRDPAFHASHAQGHDPGIVHRFRQVSVHATDIVTADVLATAILAGGRATLRAVTAEHQIEVLAIGEGGDLWATPGFRT